MINRITRCAIFTSLAIVISTLEFYIPLQSVIPIPGIKLGLSNCIILFLLCKNNFKSAMVVMFCKCAVVSLLFSGPLSFVYSVSGGILSVLVMTLLLKYNNIFSVYGVSVAGAVSHSIAQTVVASVLLKSPYVLKYLVLLLPVSIFTGLIIGAVSNEMCKRIKFKVEL